MADNDAWIHRTEVKSETSNRVYVVSQHAAKRFWGCSCPGWRAHRKCKHLERLGLPGGEQPFEVAKDHAKGFLDGGLHQRGIAGQAGCLLGMRQQRPRGDADKVARLLHPAEEDQLQV